MLRTRYPYRVIYSSRNTFRAYSQESVILKPEERADSEPVVCPESKDADPMMPLQYIPFRVDAESALKKAQDFLRGKLGMGYVYPRLLDTKESPLMKVYIPFYAFSVTARTYVSAQSRKTGQFVHHCIHHRYNSLEMKPMQILATLKIPRSYVYQFRGEAFKMMRPIYDDNDTLDHQTLKKEDLQDCEMLPFSIPPMLCLYKFIEPFIEERERKRSDLFLKAKYPKDRFDFYARTIYHDYQIAPVYYPVYMLKPEKFNPPQVMAGNDQHDDLDEEENEEQDETAAKRKETAQSQSIDTSLPRSPPIIPQAPIFIDGLDGRVSGEYVLHPWKMGMLASGLGSMAGMPWFPSSVSQFDSISSWLLVSTLAPGSITVLLCIIFPMFRSEFKQKVMESYEGLSTKSIQLYDAEQDPIKWWRPEELWERYDDFQKRATEEQQAYDWVEFQAYKEKVGMDSNESPSVAEQHQFREPKHPDPQGYYKSLGLDGLEADITSQYKKLAFMHHPDRQKSLEQKHANVEKFREITQAYLTLKDQQKRRNYDLFGK